MKHPSLLLTGVALLALSGTPALGNCADEIASLSDQAGTTVGAGDTASGGTVAKDGSTAPLEQPDASATTGAAAATPEADGMAAGETSGPAAREAGVASGGEAAGGDKIAKDGSTMPLSDDGTPPVDTAMSQQDADAQQGGGMTAAAEASGADTSMDGEVMAALNRARAAEQAGDEAGCMKAIEEARSLQAP
jgi:hypothetical protein